MKRSLPLLCAACLIFAAHAPTHAGMVYTGFSDNKASTPNAFAAPDDKTWATDGIRLEWTVTELTGGLWSYSYSFYNPTDDEGEIAGALSNIIIELSAGVVESDLREIKINGETPTEEDDVEVRLFTEGEPGSGGDLPGDIYGVKFEGFSEDEDQNPFTFSFEIYRAPVWGDFFAKDGSVGGYGYNTDFLEIDPDGDASNTSDLSVTDARYFKILRPDTVSTGPDPGPAVVPEPSTLALAIGCIAPLAAIRMIRRRRPATGDAA